MSNDQGDAVQFISIPELPDELTTEAHEAVRCHAVSLVAADDDETAGVPCAGTFVRIGGVSGILTVRHAWEAIRKRSKLILFIGGKPYRLGRSELTDLTPGIEERLQDRPADVPDLTLIPLSSSHIASIEARGKAFYSIDRRIDDDAFDLFGDDGLWTVVGSPAALLDVERRMVGSFVYDTDVEQRFFQGQWDFTVINLKVESNPDIPTEYGGMSGGGLWRARYSVNSDRSKFWFDDVHRDVILVGVVFFETGRDGRQLIAHGPKSIYQRLPPLIRALSGQE